MSDEFWDEKREVRTLQKSEGFKKKKLFINTMQEEIFDLLLNQEELSWKSILVDLVQTEQMDPWDIDITLLTQRYIQAIKLMQENNLRVSGKILLAAAFLLKLKSDHLVDNDLSKFDTLIHQSEQEIEEELLGMLDEGTREKRAREKFALIPRNPQPRNRKVSIQDLVEALQQAMASKKKVLTRIRPVKFTMPGRRMDIVEAIRDVFHKVMYYNEKNVNGEKVSFTQLLPPQAMKQDKVVTFVPLLHLENHEKIEMEQEKPFEEIYISVKGRGTRE